MAYSAADQRNAASVNTPPTPVRREFWGEDEIFGCTATAWAVDHRRESENTPLFNRWAAPVSFGLARLSKYTLKGFPPPVLPLL